MDAALYSLIFRNMPHAELDWFTIEGKYELSSSAGSTPTISYELLSNQSQLYPYDVIIYWGDFLHSRRFHVEHIIPRTRIRNPGEDFSARIFDTLLLENAPEKLLRKVICFGGSIYFDSPHDGAEKRHRDAISRLYSNARLVMMRDPISAALAPAYGAHGSTLGVDCALLLQPCAALNWDRKPDRGNGGIGYSFNRVLSRDRRRLRLMSQFVTSLTDLLRLAPPIDLDWLKPNEEALLCGLATKLSCINRCYLVVTDTYHCAVNALREGIPTICIGIGSQHPADPLSEKKKELLFSMFNANAFYLYFEEITRSRSCAQVAARVAETLQDRGLFDSIGGNIRIATAMAERRLWKAIEWSKNT